LRRLDLTQEGGNVDPAVVGRERPDPASRLRQLPFEAGPVAAPGLVPGDDDVHETLEEVLLLRLGRSPGVLERLVRREVLAAAGEVETPFEIS
jgi:hypothetical protein